MVSSTRTEETVEVLRSMFARFTFPLIIVSDNGPPFRKKFTEFLKNNGIRYLPFSVYGQAERFVRQFKEAIQAGK